MMARPGKTSTSATGVNEILRFCQRGEPPPHKNRASSCSITTVIHQEQIIKYSDFGQRGGHEIEAGEWVRCNLFY